MCINLACYRSDETKERLASKFFKYTNPTGMLVIAKTF